MNEINNKRNKLLFVLGIIALLLVVIGATYAYFAVTTVNNFGTSTINAQAGNIGTVTLNGNSAQLNMSLTALDMVQGNSDITYYASSSGKTTTPTEEVIGTASVSPTSDTNTYHCTYTLSVTHSGTNDMYTVFSGATNKSAGQIILTINGVDYDFNDGWPTSNQVSGSFYIKGTQTKNITAGFRIINKSNVNQNYLANTDISISISLVNNSFSCTATEDYIRRMGTDETTGLPVVRIGTEEFYDITNAINYTNLINTNGNIYNYANDKSILLAKYNLYVGQNCTDASTCVPISTSASGYGLQSVDAKGYLGNWDNPAVGVVPFSGSNNTYGYWDPSNSGINSTYGTYTNYANNIYDTDYVTAPNYSAAFSNSAGNVNYSVAYYVEEYVNRLGIDGTGRLLTYPEANAMTQTQRTNGARFWLGSARSSSGVRNVYDSGDLSNNGFNYANGFGVRPVIVVSTSDIGA